MSLAVIIPVYNDAANLTECLQAILSGIRVPDDIIVVDDASTDASGEVARSFGVHVLRVPINSGPAVCRNMAAQHTECDLLVFLDADTTAHLDTIQGLEKHLLLDEGLAAVIGSYDDRPQASGYVSQFRNLMHHFVHSKASPRALTFWSGCGAIRRCALLRAGGFDARFRKPSVEDIELGYRLSAAGERILLDPALKVTHLKRWTLRSGIRTDVLSRGAPWFRLMLERRNMPDDLNVTVRYRLSTAATALGWLLLPLTVIKLEILFATAFLFGCATLLHADLLAFFARTKGIRFLLVAVPLHLLQQTCNLAAVAIGSVDYLRARSAKGKA